MNFFVEFVLLFIAAYIEISATDESLCADAEILKKKFPQLSDCVLTWIKRIPENIDDYCVNSKDLQDFCSRLDKYKKESRDSSCDAFRLNIDQWTECMAFLNFQQQAVCRSDIKCSRIALYDAIPYCNSETDLNDYQSCMERGSKASPSLLKGEYFGVPTYMIVIIVVLCVVLITLLILHKSEKRRKKKRNEESLDKMESSVASSESSTSLKARSKKSIPK